MRATIRRAKQRAADGAVPASGCKEHTDTVCPGPLRNALTVVVGEGRLREVWAAKHPQHDLQRSMRPMRMIMVYLLPNIAWSSALQLT